MNLNSILVFSDNPKKLVEQYKKILQKEPGWSGGDFSGFQVGDGYLTIGPHDKVKGKNKNPERMMINFEVEDVEGEFKRIKELGCKVIAEVYHPTEDPKESIATFADEDGNFFQLMTPMSEEM